tara:strand:+ start:3888 stop:4886 length:999 start_codon:yes stop_codon:yes gene_type:complete
LLKRLYKKKYNIDDINNLVKNDLIEVQKIIKNNIGDKIPLIDNLANHILTAGGKKIRPIVTLLTSKLCNYSGKNHLSLAACVELIHTATLLHDDVIDESKMRRGIPTANDLFGNKSSVLVGDFLFSKSFELMVANGSKSILKILSKTSSTLAEGEVMQLITIKNYLTDDQSYMNIIKAKTASLFSAASEISALLTNQDNQTQKNLKKYGEYLGTAFQLVDDALDYIGNEKLGKKIGDDFREGKITLPVIIAISNSDKEEKNFWKRVIELENRNEDDFKRALKIIEKYDGINITMNRALEFSECAIKSLNHFPESNFKNALQDLPKIAVYRNK